VRATPPSWGPASENPAPKRKSANSLFVIYSGTSSRGSARLIAGAGGVFDFTGLTSTGKTAGSFEGAGRSISVRKRSPSAATWPALGSEFVKLAKAHSEQNGGLIAPSRSHDFNAFRITLSRAANRSYPLERDLVHMTGV